MRSIHLLLFCLFLCSFSSVYAQQDFLPMKDSVTFKARIAARAVKTTTIESDFIQEKNLSVLSEKIISKGHFYFKKENMLRWEYADPFNYVIIINKDKVLIKDEDKVSRYDMNANKMFKSINDLMVSSVQGNLLNTKDYSIKYFENAQYFIAELTPLQKGAKEVLKTINLFFDKNEFFVTRVKMTEPSGDYTSIDFINHKNNESIPDTKFTIH